MAEAMGIVDLPLQGDRSSSIAALLAAISGWLFAHFQRTVNPSPFGLNMGIEYLFMAVLGGVGHVWGAFVGAGAVKLIEGPAAGVLPALIGTSGNYEIIVFGVLIVLVLQYAPRRPLAGASSVERWLPPPRREVDWADAPRAARAAAAARTASVLLDVQAVRKEFGGLVAVNDVSFELRAGEILGLIGPNGAGKSTTFNLVTGVLPLTRGERRVRRPAASAACRRARSRASASRAPSST